MFDDEGVYSYATLPPSPSKGSNSLVANFKTLLLGPRQPSQQQQQQQPRSVSHVKEHRQTTAAAAAARRSKMVHSLSADATLSLLDQQSAQSSILNEHRDSMLLSTCYFVNNRRMQPQPPPPPNLIPSGLPGPSRVFPTDYYEQLSATTSTTATPPQQTQPFFHLRCSIESDVAAAAATSSVCHHHIAIKEEEIDHLLHGYAPRMQRPTKSASTDFVKPMQTMTRSLPRSVRKSCLKQNNNNNHNNNNNNNVSTVNINNINIGMNASQAPRKTVSIQELRSEPFAQKNYSPRDELIHNKSIASQSLATTKSLCNSADVYELIDFPYEEEALSSAENLTKTSNLSALQQAARQFGATYTELDFCCSSSSSSSSSCCTSPDLSTTRRRMSWSSSSASSVSIEMQHLNVESLALKCTELCSAKRLANIYSTSSLNQRKNQSRQTVITIL